jgi:hypothetical protein
MRSDYDYHVYELTCHRRQLGAALQACTQSSIRRCAHNPCTFSADFRTFAVVFGYRIAQLDQRLPSGPMSTLGEATCGPQEEVRFDPRT